MTVLCGDFNIVAEVGAAAQITPLDVEKILRLTNPFQKKALLN